MIRVGEVNELRHWMIDPHNQVRDPAGTPQAIVAEVEAIKAERGGNI